MKTPSSNCKASFWRAAADLGSLGFTLAACIFTGVMTGYTLDRHFASEPWFTIALLALGIIAGFLNIFQKTIKPKPPKDAK